MTDEARDPCGMGEADIGRLLETTPFKHDPAAMLAYLKGLAMAAGSALMRHKFGYRLSARDMRRGASAGASRGN
ncbi:hypothetical protein H8A97_36640 [Bradyrhizobium sp. Arg62]|uniref:hypothetical protein n=1 Tax=Bradyrhizobium brasilense TaxID=1419277 RepID=UPI001E3C0723|nr:hypothetical protein [Bradyrhizobium brasilense]MCC8950450.1 hypothetical protein [Bradyrhizobium brasilense]